jgi:hypothetical protein
MTQGLILSTTKIMLKTIMASSLIVWAKSRFRRNSY